MFATGSPPLKRNVIEFTRASDTPDADFSQLRGGAVLDKLLRRYPAHADALRRAHELLFGEPGYAPAMHRVANSLNEGLIRMFISYRAGPDLEAARAVAEEFRRLSAGKIEVTFADDFTIRISGQDYKSEIEVATKAAHWFVILVSDSRELSGWCMYETGLFRASSTSRRLERLICLRHPGATPPSAIDGYHSVAGEVAQLQRLLDGLLREPNPLPGWDALNPTLDDATIEVAAARIAQALRPPRRPVQFNPIVTLVVNQPKALACPDQLNDCVVETDRLTAHLFGKSEPPTTWGALVSGLHRQGPWQQELVAVLRKAAAGDIFRQLSGNFESPQGGQVLRPMLQSMEHDSQGGEHRFQLCFLEDLGRSSDTGLAAPTQALLTAVRLHNRVRWEVVERYADTVWDADNCAAAAKALSRIDREARANGGIDAKALCAYFSSSAAAELGDVLDDWAELCEPGQGRLPTALRNADVTAVRAAMARCRELNREALQRLLPELALLSSRRG
jgi:hypothetical protein